MKRTSTAADRALAEQLAMPPTDAYWRETIPGWPILEERYPDLDEEDRPRYHTFSIELFGVAVAEDPNKDAFPWPHSKVTTGRVGVDRTTSIVQWWYAEVRSVGVPQWLEVGWRPTADGTTCHISAHGLDAEDRERDAPQEKFLRRALRLVAVVEPRRGRPRGSYRVTADEIRRVEQQFRRDNGGREPSSRYLARKFMVHRSTINRRRRATPPEG